MAALSTTALVALAAGSGLSKFAGQRKAATAAERQGNYEKGIFDMNAGVADQQAADALVRGQEAESLQRSQTRGMIGSQRAALAASGVDVSDGSAADVQADTAMLGELDARAIRNNARREAWGYQVQATNYRSQGALAQASGKNQAGALRTESFGTLLTTAANVNDIYSNRPQGVKVPKSKAPAPSSPPLVRNGKGYAPRKTSTY